MSTIIDIVDTYPVYQDVKMHVSHSRSEIKSSHALAKVSDFRNYCIFDEDRVIRLEFDHDERTYRIVRIQESGSPGSENVAGCDKMDFVPPMFKGGSYIGNSIFAVSEALISDGFYSAHSTSHCRFFVKTLPPTLRKIRGDDGGEVELNKISKMQVCVSVDANNVVTKLSLTYTENYE